ncbi:sensor histidine kinase [Roseovarius aestuarii]|uniref:sensor histidine kinase n=1 Tax=Roseovarius aestuarii TaxID=475083 RepID=UPI00366E8C78
MFLIIASQASVGLQIFRLNGVQNSILNNSVPLLEKTEEFARLTAKTLAQTTLLKRTLSALELRRLRESYQENENQSERIFDQIIASNLEPEKTEAFEASLQRFVEINETLFENQFAQRQTEQKIREVATHLMRATTQFEDFIDKLLIRATTIILTNSSKIGAGQVIVPDERNVFLIFAGEVEVLNSLKSDVIDISNIVQSDLADFENSKSGGFADKLRFRVRSITQSLTLLQQSETRSELAKLATQINESLTAPAGYIDLQNEAQKAKRDFDELKGDQAVAVNDIDAKVEQIVFEATGSFETDIILAADLTRIIMGIGISTSLFVLSAIFLLDRNVVRNQISRRFTTMTEDILTISKGDYSHSIRVHGRDELGDIAHALDVFKNQAAELERSNAELERFAYVAAHDLRSPLDAIQDLARWTLEDERDSLSASCIENLELLIKRSSRLSALQADLLTYAQVGEMDTSVKPLFLKDEIEKISDMLDPESHYHITLENDPGEIVTYNLPLRQILINLITNAIKHHDRSSGRITVKFSRGGGQLKFVVEDDGPGIEPRFQGQIFELFKTLQSRDRVEGSGLGLALVTKVVERLGGKILVQSDAPQERGTRFVFEITDFSEESEVSRAA